MQNFGIKHISASTITREMLEAHFEAGKVMVREYELAGIKNLVNHFGGVAATAQWAGVPPLSIRLALTKGKCPRRVALFAHFDEAVPFTLYDLVANAQHILDVHEASFGYLGIPDEWTEKRNATRAHYFGEGEQQTLQFEET